MNRLRDLLERLRSFARAEPETVLVVPMLIVLVIFLVLSLYFA